MWLGNRVRGLNGIMYNSPGLESMRLPNTNCCEELRSTLESIKIHPITAINIFILYDTIMEYSIYIAFLNIKKC